MKIERKMPTPEQFEAIYRSVGWDAPGLEQIRVALNHSLQGFMIFDDGKPIGMARLLGDYAMAYLIKDVAVLPEYQHRGAGTLLMLRWDMSSVFKSSHMPRGFSGKRNGTLRI